MSILQMFCTQSSFVIIALIFLLQFIISSSFQSPKTSRIRAHHGLTSLKNDNTDALSFAEGRFDYEGRLLAPDPNYRCGFVSLIGAANMGKSSLLNALLEETLCTTTHRPQTTRHAILGVLTSDASKCQLCFLDTPGVIENPSYKLQEGMMEAVKGAFRDSDVILVVTDMFSTPIPDDDLFRKLNLSEKKKIVCINKIDLVEKIGSGENQQRYHGNEEEFEEEGNRYKRTLSVAEAVLNWRELVPDAVAIIPMSAREGSVNVGVTALRTLLLGGPDVPKAFRDLGRPLEGMFLPGMKTINDDEASKIIPISPPLYDLDTLTDKSER
jgi:small GTP-binding protein